MKPQNKMEFLLPDKNLKCNFYDPTVDDGVIGTIKYLREQGKNCEFLGFIIKNSYVVLIDGVKYYGHVNGRIDTNYYATFYVVDDEEHDYKEKYREKRVVQILDYLKY